MVDLPTLTLSVWRQGPEILCHLSDGRGLQAFGACDRTPDGLALDDRVLTALRQASASRVHLQIADELDDLAWEACGDHVLSLGVRFALARFLPGHSAFHSVPADRRPVDLSVVQFSDEDLLNLMSMRPPAAFGVLRLLHPVELSAIPWAWLRQRTLGPCLFVVPVTDARAVPALAREVVVDGASLLIHRLRPGESSAEGTWFESLREALAGACTPAEAVRRVRAALPDPGSVDLRLYGGSDEGLVRPAAADAASDGFRQVTVLSFDLVNSTGLMQRLGEERYSHLLDNYHRQCAALIRLHGGTVDNPQGDDGMMSYFGFPAAQEGSARRALRAALEMVRAVSDMGLAIRIGLATGRVAVSNGQLVGMVVHLAARIQAQAAPNTALAAGSTRRLVGDDFEFKLLARQMVLKGFADPQDLFLVQGESTRRDTARPGGLTPFVGRKDELELLQGLWRRVQRGESAVLFVSGEAGIGKSRLLREFRHTADAGAADFFICRGRSEWAGSALLVLIEALRDRLQLPMQADVATCRQTLTTALPPGVAAQAQPALELVAELLAGMPSATAPGSAERRRQQVVSLLVAWMREAARRRPICLIVDDVHWIDPSTRDVLGQVVEGCADVPLLVILAARTDADPGWRPARLTHVLDLQGLSPPLAWQIIRCAAGGASLDDGFVRLLAARADGVPLFLEESAHMAMEQRADELRQQTPLQMEMPSTLHDVLMARLDRLGASRVLAQIGAVIGREFPASLMHAVVDAQTGSNRPDDVPARLDELHAVGVLLRVEGPRGLSYRFKHALVRDAAYESILESERRSLHESVAVVLRERFPGLARERPEHLAQHLTAAGRLDEALETWEAAARVAASRSENLEAIAHARTAMALLPRLAPTTWRDQCELRLQLLLASRQIASEGYGAEPVERAYLRAHVLARQLGDARVQAKIALGLEGYYFMRANFARARSMAESAHAEAQDSADPMQRMQANWALANVHWHQGRLLPALELMDRCLGIYQPQFHRPSSVQDPGVMCLCYSAWACWERGDAPEARARVQRVLALSQSLAHRFSQGTAEGFAASVLMFCGQHEAALAHADRAIEICDGAGFAVWLAHAVITRGRLRVQLGAIDEGCAEMQRGYAMWVRTGAMVTRPYYLTLQAEGRLLAGRPDEAEPLLQEALRIADAGGEHYHSAEVLRLLGDVAASRGEPQAQGLRRQAYEQAHAQGKRVFALRAALGWARASRLEGPAFAALRQAVADLPAPADYPEAAEAAALLATVTSATPPVPTTPPRSSPPQGSTRTST